MITRRQCLRLAALAPGMVAPGGTGREYELIRARCRDVVSKRRLLDYLGGLRAIGAPLAVFDAIAAAHLPEILWVGPSGLLEGVAVDAALIRGPHRFPSEILFRSEAKILEISRHAFGRMEFRLFRCLAERAAIWNPGGVPRSPIEISLYRRLPG